MPSRAAVTYVNQNCECIHFDLTPSLQTVYLLQEPQNHPSVLTRSVSRMYGCRFFLAYFYKFLILLTLQFLFCFRKQKIKGGKKRKRNSFWGQSTANGEGDFDVFASCPSGNPHINSLVAVKKQPKRKIPHPPEIGFAYFPLKEIC